MRWKLGTLDRLLLLHSRRIPLQGNIGLLLLRLRFIDAFCLLGSQILQLLLRKLVLLVFFL